MGGEVRAHRPVRHAWVVACALALLSFVFALLIGNWLFPNLSANNDEAVYVLEAKNFGEGHLTLSDSLHGDAFRPWMSGRVGDDRLVLVEQPLLPGLMAATDKVFGSMRVAVGLIAAGAVLAIFALTRELLGDERIALASAATFVLSPLVLVQSAMYVSYVLAVALAATTLTLLTRALDRRAEDRAWRPWLMSAGAVHGVLLITRPLEGIVLGLVSLAWLALRRTGLRGIGTAVGFMAVGVAPILALGLLYNALTTGHPTTFALWTIGGDDSFGFGPRSVADHAQYVDVGVSQAWLALRTNLRAFPHWIVGGLVCLPVAAWGAWTLWKQHRRPVLGLCAFMLVAYPFAYFFYYGNYLIIGGRNLYGPHYYLPLLIPTVVLVGVGVVDLWRHKLAFAAVGVAVVVGTAIEIPDKVDFNLRVRDDIAAEVDAVNAAVQEPALVIIPQGVDGPYVLHPRGALGNPPGLDGPLLYAADLEGRNVDLFDRFPDRAFYRLQVVEGPDGFGPQVDPLQAVRAPEVEVALNVTRTSGATLALAYVEVAGRRIRCAQQAGAASLQMTVSSAGVTVEGCEANPTTVSTDATTATATVGLVESTPDGDREVQVRWWYGEVGDDVVVIAPGETWVRPPGADGFHVVDPALVPGIDTSVTPAP